MTSAIDQAQEQEQQTASMTAQQLRAAMLATGTALRTHSMQSTADPRLTAHLPYRQEFRALLDGLTAALPLLANVTGSSGGQQVTLNWAMALLREAAGAAQ